jgi:hypothetical protein
MKKLSLTIFFAAFVVIADAQRDTSSKSTKNDKKELRRQKVNAMIKQSEEGVLVYSKQSIFGIQGRSNGYGIFYELGKMKTIRKTNTYRIDLTEIKHQKETKLSSSGGLTPFSNPFIYGKINNFYQVTLAFGQQYMLGQKGNKNGVAVSAVFNGGLALGLLKPYYLEVEDPNTGKNITIKYTQADSALFFGKIQGGGGIGKGWNEIKVKPGVFAKAAMRFDYGRFNEIVSGIEAGVSVEYYGSKIPIMVTQKEKQIFFQGYIAILFGRRK